MSPTSSAARTTAVCQAAGSVTMTTTVGTTRTRRAAVCPPPPHPLPPPSRCFPPPPVDLGHLASQQPCSHPHKAALEQVATPRARGQVPLPPHPTPCCVFEFVPFHLISCFSPFSHCPLGVTEVGVSDVPCSHLTPASAPEPTCPCAVPQPIILYWPLPKPWCLS